MQSYTVDVKARQAAFPVTDLSETLQDAIAITYSLGLEFIWIDAVCVPRGSWDAEAGSMHEVYGNAHFPLTSGNTAKATDRMLMEQDAWRDNVHGCRLHDPWILNTDMPLDEVRQRSPVAARGWILQEERLSPRVLYWCAQRAYWSCSECQRIEAKQPGGIRPTENGTLGLSHPQKFIAVCRTGNSQLLQSEWAALVAAYVHRLLSGQGLDLVKNRFAALSGLSVRYLTSSSSAASRDEYLAGLWRKSIARSLAWQVKTAASPFDSLQHDIPSWTWMSLPLGAEMALSPNVEESSFFQLVTEPAVVEQWTDEDVVRNGARVTVLEVLARFRPFIGTFNAVRVPWDGIESDHHPGSFDFSLDPTCSMYARNATGRILFYEPHKEEVVGQLDYFVADEVSCATVEVGEGLERSLYCLEVGVQAMILVERMSMEEDRFRRVGVSLGYRKDFFDDSEVRQLRLV